MYHNHGNRLLVAILPCMLLNNFIAFFCFILSFAVAQSQELTYNSDIKPIIERNCISCHQPNEVGPMPLTNYEEVVAYGKMIQYVTTSRLMPPWYADPAYNHFKNERVLSGEEIQKINDWVSGDMKEGAMPYGLAVSSSVKVTVLPREPDLIIPMQESFEQFGIYMDQYQVFVLQTDLTEDVWLEGIEFIPGNKKIVRHASISLAPEGTFDSLDKWDPRYGYFSFGGIGKTTDLPYWYTWSPQQEASFYKEGTGKLLPKGSEFIVHIHYGPTGKPVNDSSQIRLYFARENINKQIVTAPLINPYNLTGDSLFIDANVKKVFHASYTLPYEIELFSITPQANLINRTWEIYAEIPDQPESIRLLKIKDWNINWKQTYHLTKPLSLPAGTIIHTLALYDNTTDNLCNPLDKPVPIKPGAHLFNELFLVHFEFIAKDYARPLHLIAPVTVSSSQLHVRFKSDKKTHYRLQLIDAVSGSLVVNDVYKSTKGNNEYFISIGELPLGNYTMIILNEQGDLIAHHMFVKMGPGGI